MPTNAGEQARLLAEAGRSEEALQMLRQAQEQGDAGAFFAEGVWRLEGRFLNRDAAAARASFARATEAGHVEASRVLAALVARGAGVPPDWPGSLEILTRWKDRDPLAARQLDLIEKMDLDENGNPSRKLSTKTISDQPRIARVDVFLSRDECALLVDLAEPRMKRSMIFDDAQQRFVEDPIRTSDLAGFPVFFESPFVRAINLRIADATRTALECGEPLQVLRYLPGQQYRPHYDSRVGLENPRVLTVLIWLNDEFTGGETCFDAIGVAERGAPGDLLFFANTLPDESPDPRSRHAGAPVLDGVKYLASRWIRARPWQQGDGRLQRLSR